MTKRSVKFLDRFRNVLATARVADEGDHFGGTIELERMPVELRRLFDEFEEVVNGQMFSFLDEVQEKISSFPLKVVFEDGEEVSVKDLQIYPSTGNVSFKLSEVPTPGTN
jgi:hypothetical protein